MINKFNIILNIMISYNMVNKYMNLVMDIEINVYYTVLSKCLHIPLQLTMMRIIMLKFLDLPLFIIFIVHWHNFSFIHHKVKVLKNQSYSYFCPWRFRGLT